MCVSVRVDVLKTGDNILQLRKQKKLTVKDIQKAMGFNTPQAIFKWQRGEALPSIDNLVVLSELFEIPIDEIIIRIR